MFVAHLSSFVKVWSEGLRSCKQPKETKGSVLEKFQSHQHILGLAARSGQGVEMHWITINVPSAPGFSSIFEHCQVSFCGTITSTSQSKHFRFNCHEFVCEGLSWRDIVKLLGALPECPTSEATAPGRQASQGSKSLHLELQNGRWCYGTPKLSFTCLTPPAKGVVMVMFAPTRKWSVVLTNSNDLKWTSSNQKTSSKMRCSESAASFSTNTHTASSMAAYRNPDTLAGDPEQNPAHPVGPLHQRSKSSTETGGRERKGTCCVRVKTSP